ncbi:hypothetical protein PHISCL_09325 [Aspergillus sclerotialis]|uniref:Uncharacterized protein n=1 Tax=Aspergillus sclerotialis TaxID=2070753 RepID=A0A3A2Z675_9EURO|nr:hypothetical protein PHISCL_09325 [Aspergillus sclerotialis]
MHQKALLSLLSLSATIFTGLTQAASTDDKKICTISRDPNTCTLTVVSQLETDTTEETQTDNSFVYVLNNECTSIIDSDDCNDDGLCLLYINDAIDEVSVPVQGQESDLMITAKEAGETLHGDPGNGEAPIFSFQMGDYYSNDWEGNDDAPCTCALSKHGSNPIVNAQVCSCRYPCSG